MNVRPEVIKFQEGNIGSTFFKFNIGFSNFFFFGYISSAKINKSKHKQMVLHQTEKNFFFFTVKKTIYKTKRPATEWEKYL